MNGLRRLPRTLQPAPHIHHPDDGRGGRRVYLNGKQLFRCVYADTRKGKVVFPDSPYKLHKHGKRVIIRTRYGVVDVLFPRRDGGWDHA